MSKIKVRLILNFNAFSLSLQWRHVGTSASQITCDNSTVYHLYGKYTGRKRASDDHRWIPLTKASTA